MPEYTIPGWAAKLEREIDRQVRGLKIELFSHVVLNTRVKTGLLRGNWQISNGAPIHAKTKRLDPTGSQVTSEIPAHVTGDEIPTYLSNNLEYAPRWNEVDGYVDSTRALFGQLTKIMKM